MVYKNKKGSEMKKPEIRYLYDIKKVLWDKEWLKTSPNFEIYYMYRGVKQKNKIRYDITVIPPRMLGREFIKTKGHYHFGNYGELYKVLSGKGIFLMQKCKKGKVEDVYYVRAKKGDYVPVPPEYGHTTINPSPKTLKMANWIFEECSSDYKRIEEKEGFCYYYTKLGWFKNKNYKKIPKLRYKRSLKLKPKNLDFLCLQ